MKRIAIVFFVCMLYFACSKKCLLVNDNIVLSNRLIEKELIGKWKYENSYISDTIHFYSKNEDNGPFFREITFQKSKTTNMIYLLRYIKYFHYNNKFAKPLKNMVCYHPDLINWIGAYSVPILIRDSTYNISNETYIGEKYKIEHCIQNDTNIIYGFEYYIIKLSKDSMLVSSSWNCSDVPIHLYCKLR